MFYLHTSNRTENLLRQLAALYEADTQNSVFEKEYILIQSQGMERMISQYLADCFTSWCNYRFCLPVTFLQDIASRLGMTISPDSYERSFLVWRIEEKLRNVSSEAFTMIRQYLSGADSDLKRFQLARQLANIFDQYQLMRPQMLREWQRNRRVTSESAERWQMDLWRRLTAETGGADHRGEMLYSVIAALRSLRTIPSMPKRVSVFGLHSMPPFFLDYLDGLSGHCDVHLFLLSPCRRYWGDLRKSSDASGTDESGHPLLALLGKQGREFQEMLLGRISFYQEFSSYEPPAQGSSATLLHVLQADLLEGRVLGKLHDYSDDRSLRMVSCHSKQRELEVLRDHILDTLERNPELELRDIVVMAPDIQQYAPLIPGLFEDIQHSIADRSLFRRNTYASGFQEFISLIGGRFGWSEVLDLLGREEIHPHFELTSADFQRLQDWVVKSGIRWGLSTERRRAEGFDFYENSWQAGLERMLMGCAVNSEEKVNGIYPFTGIEGNEALPLGGLCEFISLLDRAVSELSQTMTLERWSDVLTGYAEQLFGRTEQRDLLELQDILRRLKEYGFQHKGAVGLATIRYWFETSTRESRTASGFLKGQLTFCSMLPMRSIPFQVVCLLGMNHGDFPKSEYQATFDLMHMHPLPGDRSVRADDRYQFLEAILSARQNLYISYLGQSLKDNQKLPPAVVVAELIDVLEMSYGARDLIEHHPLHGFSKKYFSGDSALFSYDQSKLAVAQALAGVKQPVVPWWTGARDTETGDIDCDDLIRFYLNPQLFFVRNCLDVSVDGNAEIYDEAELFEVTGLDLYMADQEILQMLFEGGESSSVLERLRQKAGWPLSSSGKLTFKRRERELGLFLETVLSLGLGDRLDDRPVALTLENCRLTGRLTGIYEGGALLYRYGKLRGRDLLRGWICHLLGSSSIGLNHRTHMVMKDVVITFASTSYEKPSLERLVEVYREGLRRPCPLLVEPAHEYCAQITSKTARVEPIVKARDVFRYRLDNGYEPAWSLLYRNLQPEKVVDESFVALCEEIMLPLWRVLR